MAGYGELISTRFGVFDWTIDDVISLDSVRSPSFLFENVLFHLRLTVYQRDDRLQLSIHTEVNIKEKFQISFTMNTGSIGDMESRSGRLDKEDFFIRRWMPWSEMLKRRLEILSNGCLLVKVRLQKEENPYISERIALSLPSRSDEISAEERKSSNSHEKLRTSVLEKLGKIGTNNATSQEDSDEEDSSMLSQNFRELRRALKSLFDSRENSDVIIRVQGKEFPAHRCILGMRSPVFKSTFQHEMTEKQTGYLDIDDCDPETFRDFLYHVYTGSTIHIDSENVCNLYALAHKYALNELKQACLSFLKSNLTCEAFCDTMALALLYEEEELVRLASDFFCDFAHKIVGTVEWQVFLEKNSTVGNELFRKALNVRKLT